MFAAYGIDVTDPAVTPRRVAVLLRRMPPQYRGGGATWTTEADLLAHVIDQLAVLTYVTLRAAGAKSVPKPRPVPRPGDPVRAGHAQPARNPAGQVRHGSWSDAARALAGLPGMDG